MKKIKQDTKKEHKIEETYEYIHKGISIFVSINYLNNEISLVDGDNTRMTKKWVFADRGVEFMGSWLNILEAMQEAIKDAKTKYEHNHAIESAFKNDQTVKMLGSVNEARKRLDNFFGGDDIYKGNKA